MKAKLFALIIGMSRDQVATQAIGRKSESLLRSSVRKEVAGCGSFSRTLAALFSLSVTALWLSVSPAFFDISIKTLRNAT
jgi:hypothetical protein